MLKGHGANTHAYSDILADFSSNVSWVDYSNVLGAIISRNIEQLNTYPDVEYNQFREELAQFHGLEPENFLVTNGAVSGIYQ
jgi:threonine-phosphate decarboxylase